MSVGDWLMGIAVVLFCAGGIAKGVEGERGLAAALIMLGLANGILLSLSRSG